MKTINITPNLNVKYIDVSALRPAAYNPRTWPDKTIEDLKKSISDNGFVIPLLANKAKGRENVLISGHFRLKVAKDLGYKKLPVTFVDIPDIKKEQALNLAINRISGEWDFELLKNFDVEMLLDVGFDDSDLSAIWDKNLGVEDDDFNTEKELAEIKTPTTKLRDFLKLGNHYLLCGDATDPKVVQRLVGNEKMGTIYCDPPYNIDLDYNGGISSKGKYGGKNSGQ